MKKILFALLIFAFVGCEGEIGTGDLYLIPEEDEIQYTHISVYRSNSNTEVLSDDINHPKYYKLPVGNYRIVASRKYFEMYSELETDFPINKNDITTIHLNLRVKYDD